MAKYVSGRQKNLKVGISSYSENLTSIEVIGNVGIATTNATSKLYVVGDGYFTGIVTASNLNFGNSLVGAAGSFSQLNVSGITTLGITSTTNLTSQQLNVSGITTLGVTSTTNLTSQQLNVSGITTLGITSTTNLTSRQLNVSGITTLGITSATNLTAQQLNVSGITTLGIVTSGNIYSTGVVTATQFSTGSGTLGFTTNTINGPSEIIIDPSPVGVGTTSGAVRIRGDLYVDGTQFIVNSTTIELADFNVGIATTVGTNILLDGAGIGIGSANIRKTFTYSSSPSDSLKSSENFDIASGKVYKIAGTEVLSSTQLTVANINATGISTLGITSTTNLTSQQLNVSGISTFNGNVYVPSSSVGIGTTNPLQRLQVGTANTLGINTTGTVFVVTSNADVGIGTTNPTSKLHVIGDGRFTGVITATTFSGTLSGFASTAGVSTSVIGGIASVTQLTVSGISTFNNNVHIPSSSVGIGTTNPLQRLQVGTANTLGINTTGTVFVVTSNADVGIGTTNPTSKLHVIGNVLIVGVSTLGITSTTNLTSQQLNVSGITTLGITSATNLTSQQLNVSGIATLGVTSSTNLTSQQLNVSGISTLGVTSTTNLTSQQLNVSGITTVGFITATNLYVAGVGTFQSSNLKIVGASTSFQYSIAGGAIAADRTLNLPVITTTDTVATLGLSQTFSGNITVSSGNITHTGTTQNFTAGSYTTGTVTIGGLLQTGTITLGRATTSQTLNLATGVSLASTTKTINFGTGGATDSFTQINIGPTAGVGTVVINSGTNLGIGTASPTTKLTISGSTGISFADTNIRIGDSLTGSSITGGINNFFGGSGAGQNTNTGNENVFIGLLAGEYNTTGDGNTFVGKNSGNNNIEGYYNTFLGSSAGYGNTTGSYNIFMGDRSGFNNKTDYNIALGADSAFSNATGNNNIYLGAYSGLSTSASNKIIIGSGAAFPFYTYFDSPNTTKDTQFAVGVRTDDNDSKYWLVGDENFNIGIGTTNPTSKLHVIGNVLIAGITTSGGFNATTGTDYKINNTSVLTSTTLGSAVVNSSLTSVGTLGSLTVTGISTFTNGPVLVGTATSTGTASQRLQVNSGAYFNGEVGIGTTNPFGSNLYNGLDVNRTNVKIFARNIGTTSDAAVWAADQDYFVGIGTTTPSYKGVGIVKYGPGAAGTIFSSIPFADAGVLSFQNTTNALIYTNGQTPLIFGTYSVERARFNAIDGNFGIGTTTPTSKLHVVGDVLVSGVITATTFSGTLSGFASTAGVSTSVIGGIASVTQLTVSGVSTFNGNVYVPSSSVGIGTTNPLQRLQIGTANTLGINTTGTVFVVTSNADVGIGTTNPRVKLDVVGDGRFTGVITATTFVGSLTGTASTAGVSTSVIGGIASVTQLSVSGISTFNNNVHIPSSSVGIGTTNPLQRLQVGTANTLGINTTGTVFVVTSNADVGIGTTNPIAKLHVIGDGRFTGVITATTFVGSLTGTASTAGVSTSVIGGIASVTQLSVSGISTFNGNVYVPSSSVGIGTTNPLQRLQVGTANTLGINTTGTVFVVTSNADVGIGTTNPRVKLDVVGDGRFTGVITATTFSGSGANLTGLVPNTVSTSSTTEPQFIGFLTTSSGVTTSILASSTLTFIPSSGNLGIGTTNPGSKLTVNGAVQIQQDSGSNNRFILRGQPASSYRWNIDNNGSTNDFRIFREDDATAANGSVAVSISTIGTLTATKFSGDGSSLTNLPSASSQWVTTSVGIHTLSNVGIGTTNPLQRLQIGTANTLGINTNGTVFVVTSNADVGIGTTNPRVKLDVVGDGRFTGVVTATTFVGTLSGFASTAGVSTSVIGGIASVTQLSVSGVSTFNNNVHIPSSSVGIGTTNPLQRLQVGTANTLGINTNGTVFVVTSNADVGIGTTNPIAKLHVIGDGRFTGVITATTFVGSLTGTASSIKSGSGGQILYQSAADTTAFLANGTGGYILQSNGGTSAPSWVPAAPSNSITGLTIRDEGTIVGGANSVSTLNFVGAIVSVASTAGIATITFLDYVGNAGVATYATNAGIATNLKGGDIGNIPYQSGSDATVFLTNGGSGTILQSNGIGATPSWITPAPAGAITGLTIRDENQVVGGANSVSTLNFVGAIVSAASTAGIATITFLDYVSNAGMASALTSTASVNTTGIITASQFSTGSSGIGINTDTISGPAIMYIDPSPVGVGTTSGIVRIRGDLYVDGTQFVVNSTTIELADLRVGIATTVGTSLLLDGGGIGIGSANIIKTITWNHTAQALTSNADWNLESGKQYEIDNTPVLTSTTLGTTVVNSSLASVGTLGSLNVSGTSTFQGQIQSTQANNTATGGGQIYLNGATGNRIDFNTNGVAAPAFTTRSAGTKLVLYPSISGSAVDFAFGIQSATLWSSVPEFVSAYQFRWYGGTTQLADLKGTGEFLLGSSTLTGTASQPLQVTGSAYVSGNLGIGITNTSNKLEVFGGNVRFVTAGAGDVTITHSNLVSTIKGATTTQVALGAGNVEAIRINTSGSVGIGTTNPQDTLDVGIGTIRLYNKSSLTRFSQIYQDGALNFKNSVVGDDFIFYGASNLLMRLNGSGELVIGTTNLTGTASQRLQVTGGAYVSGSVGIGTTNPTTTLQVQGSTIITGITSIRDVTIDKSIASPNATVPVAIIGVTTSGISTETNIDVVLLAKGTGATLAQVPDGTSVGGNKRGTYATDWQKSRTTASGVASGNLSTLSGGNNNTASGTNSTIGGGSGNTASATSAIVAGGDSNTAQSSNAVVCGGTSNTASGSFSFIGGGASNIASGQYSTVAGGDSNSATSTASFVGGGVRGTTRSIIGYNVSPSCDSPIAGTLGVTQSALLLLGRQTTDATATVLASNNSAAAATNQVTLPNNSAYFFKGSCIAGVTGAGNTKAWEFRGAIKRGANAAATSIVGSVIKDVIASDAGASTWDITITADTTNGAIAVTVTGAASTTIRWVCKIETTEMTY